MTYVHFFLRLWFVIMVPEETILEKMSTKRAHLDQNVQKEQQKHTRDCASMKIRTINKGFYQYEIRKKNWNLPLLFSMN